MRVSKVTVTRTSQSPCVTRQSSEGYPVSEQVPFFTVHLEKGEGDEVSLIDMSDRANQYKCGAGFDHHGLFVMIPESVAIEHNITSAEEAATFVATTALKGMA